MALSLTPLIPEVAFSVAATLTSNTNGAALPSTPVNITLRPATDPDAPMCDTVRSCIVTSGEPFSPACQLALPCIGRFVLEACANVVDVDARPQRTCTRQFLGHNVSDWATLSLLVHPDPQLFADK